MEKYNLTQTGQEVQNILNNATPQSELTAETERAQLAEQQLQNDIDAIEEKIPSGASSSNKLATEEYVDDSVSTATATFRGTFNLVSDLGLTVDATEQQIAAALASEISTADNNDYCFVQIPTSAETPTEIEEIDRYKFNGTAWSFEYELNNSGFTAEQWDAINSHITSGDVAKLLALPTNAELTTLLNGKQNVLTFDNVPTDNSNNPVKSGGVKSAIDDEKGARLNGDAALHQAIDGINGKIPSDASSENKLATASDVDDEATARSNADQSIQDAIEAILLLIPTAASSLNQLADKAFVNSSIATNTATFRGTFNIVNDLHLTLAATHAQVGNAFALAIQESDNNDYAFVQIPTVETAPNEIAQTDRYKFNGSTWEYEYTLNNSGFTSAQWIAINSGITSVLVSKLSELPTNSELTSELGALTTAINNINLKIPAAAAQNNKLVDTAALESYIIQVLDVLTVSYNVTSSDGHITFHIEQTDGKITAVTLTTNDIASANDLTVLAGRVTTAENDIDALESRVGTNEADIALLQAAYGALTQSDPEIIQPTDTWPVAHPALNVIYRVVDRVNTPPEYYSDYMWNGTTMVLMATYNNAIDDVPTPGSNNLVKSGGVAASIVYDISAANAVGGTLATYADLNAALGTNGANVPVSIRKGGMSVKFVQSSDNKYAQFRCKTKDFSANPNDWAFEGISTLIDNPEFISVETDSDDRVLSGRKKNGTKVEYGDFEVKGDIINKDKALIDKNVADSTSYIENPEFLEVKTDNDGRITEATRKNGNKLFGGDVEVKGDVSANEVSAGKITLQGSEISPAATVAINSVFEDKEGRLEVRTDSEERIISYRDGDGRLHENVGIETNSLRLTAAGMTEFEQALKDDGYQPGGGGDWSDRDNIELPEPKHYALLNIIVDSLPINDNDVSEGYVEYYDGLGNYFKIACSLEAQGQSSRIYARTGGKGNYTLDLPKDIKFGSWVPQDSFHLKGSAKDVVRGMLPTSYKWAWKFMNFLNAKPNRVLMDESAINYYRATGDRITDWPTDARCLPDGFPVEVYIKGEYWGLYSWQLKKHRKNYSMDKKDYTSFFIDPDTIMTTDYQHSIWNEGPADWWTKFDIKGPKDLYCMDGSKFDGDAPQELIDSTSPYYDATNKAHKGSQTTKNLIKSFQTKYLEVKTLIDNSSIEDAKAAFNANFDYNSCMLVYIFNCLMYNNDSIRKNTLFGMYKSGKIFAALWDLDNMYGEGWIGTGASAPNSSLWTGIYATAEWPLKLLWDLYENEIKANYAVLREAGIISLDTWRDVVFGQWVNRIGEEAYNRDIKKWPDTPSYRKNMTNTDYWQQVGNVTITGHNEWDETINYSVGDEVVLRLYPDNSNCVLYRAVQANVGECPVTEFYDGFPQVGGYYDSPKRWEKWITEQIRLCDIAMGYTE